MVTDECGRSVQVLPWCDSTIRGRTSNPFRTLHWAGLNIGGGDRRVFTGARANFNICLPILLASLRNDCCVVAKKERLDIDRYGRPSLLLSELRGHFDTSEVEQVRTAAESEYVGILSTQSRRRRRPLWRKKKVRGRWWTSGEQRRGGQKRAAAVAAAAAAAAAAVKCRKQNPMFIQSFPASPGHYCLRNFMFTFVTDLPIKLPRRGRSHRRGGL